METLLQQFNRLFTVVPVSTPDLTRRAHELRYQVYCVENAFEDPSDHPVGLERDEFDEHAVQSLVFLGDLAVGTVRLVLPRQDAPAESFALQRLISPALAFRYLPIASTAEVSRFSISRAHLSHAVKAASIAPELLYSAPLIRLGLIQSLVRMSRVHQITHWCAVMDRSLIRMLDAMAIRFNPIGPPVEYHGMRQPCYCELDAVLADVRRERPGFWELLTHAVPIYVRERAESRFLQ